MVEHVGLPADGARELAERFGKDLVAIVSVDRSRDALSITTWGRDSEDKELAAYYGEVIEGALGYSGGMAEAVQDYRHIEAGERAVIVDALVKSCRELSEAVQGVVSDEYLKGLLSRAKAAMEAA